MRWRVVRRAFSVLVVATLALGAGGAMATPPVELTADVDESSIVCTKRGLRVSATAQVPEGSGAYLRDAFLSAGEFRQIEDSWTPFTNTRVAEWWSTDERWGRRDAVTSSTLAVETRPSGDWDHHSWTGSLDGPAGTATDVWQISFGASGSHRGQWLWDYDQVFVDCSGGTPAFLEPGPQSAYCVETATEPSECYE